MNIELCETNAETAGERLNPKKIINCDFGGKDKLKVIKSKIGFYKQS